MWHHLRDRRLAGHKFRRQRAVGRFFVDFACIEIGLVIELDGGQHFEAEAMAADARRTQFLKSQGFHVIRFTDREVLTATEAVLAVLHDWLVSNHPHPSPLPPVGEGANTKEPLHA